MSVSLVLLLSEVVHYTFLDKYANENLVILRHIHSDKGIACLNYRGAV